MIGKLTGIVGPMFSGKSTKLIEIYDNKIDKENCLIFKPEIDIRYGIDKICTHDNIHRGALPIESSQSLKLIDYTIIKNVFIDEVHFFDSNIVFVIDDLIQLGINVYFAGINIDVHGHPMGFKGYNSQGFHMGELLIKCDQIYLLTALCESCGKTATRTVRIDNSGSFVGGKEKYQPRCREHL